MEKDWKAADAAREELAEMGITVIDTSQRSRSGKGFGKWSKRTRMQLLFACI